MCIQESRLWIMGRTGRVSEGLYCFRLRAGYHRSSEHSTAVGVLERGKEPRKKMNGACVRFWRPLDGEVRIPLWESGRMAFLGGDGNAMKDMYGAVICRQEKGLRKALVRRST